ncbi:MAG: class I SAM-dependent RNA methyltransferase, partial [Mariprofundus sp.]
SSRGQLTEILRASEYRGTPRCSVAAYCGGCALQYLRPEHHANTKNQWVRDAFRTVINTDTVQIPISDDVTNYRRRRVRWHIGADAKGYFLGFRARSSHQVIRQKQCHVLTDALQIVHDAVEPVLNSSIEAVLATQLSNGIHVVLETSKVDTVAFDLPCTTVGGLALQWWQYHGSVIRLLSQPVKLLHEELSAGDETIQVQIGPDDFVQGQFEGNHALVHQVLEWSMGARRIVDLFSGVGNLSLPLACSTGTEVTGAEIREQSVQRANANARALKVHASYVQANLFGRFDTSLFAGADVLILDPPRKGARRVCEAMGRLLPAKIIMVSCDVASGSRDAAILHAHGYRMQALRALDMFPYAGHVETMSLWTQ